MQALQKVKVKHIAKYAFLPGIIPRINAFIEQGFGWLALTMAIIYNSVRLLPNGHPYLNPQNMGKFGIRHVIAEAANNLVISKQNIDQIIIFFALLLGFLLLVLQFAAIAIALIIKPAAAGGLAAFAGLFTTAECVSPGAACLDIAHMLLDKVFAVPEMFNSRFAPPPGLGSIPPFNRGLQELFQYYSYAILVVGVFVFLYYVIVIVGETANTGTPFGRRFNHIYAPLRLVGAIGLLVPLNYGYNGGQYITLIAARMGSGFATNGWIIFNNELAPAETPIGTHKGALIARPNVGDVTHIVAFMSVVHTCRHAYEKTFPTPPNRKQVGAFLVKNIDSGGAVTTTLPGSYAGALAWAENQDIVIRFGHQYPAGSTDMNYKGNVENTCGEVTIYTNVAGEAGGGGAPSDQRVGPYVIQQTFYQLVYNLWNEQALSDFGERMTALKVRIPPDPCAVGGSLPGDCTLPPDAEFKTEQSTTAKEFYEAGLVQAYNRMVSVSANLYDISPELLRRGWGGAAIWYNHIAEWNGALVTSNINTPAQSRYPELMENMQEERRSHDQGVDTENRYCPTVEGFRAVNNVDNSAIPIAEAMCEAYKYWQTDGKGLPSEMQNSGNVFYDLLNNVFGIGGLFTMRTNDDVHPLAQLSALGKSMIEASIRNLLSALVTSAGGGMGEILGLHLGAALSSISSMFVSFASIGLAIGFILYYVLPFLPFMYFFFAVGGWVKTIFEAMVGMPLWALAHLRIDGNGFAGESASNGYFLIFEIFVRPILCIFGLVASMGIFSALARTLNGVFDLVVENLTGFDCNDCQTGQGAFGLEFKRNAIDEFFFTIIYAVLVYMLAISSFKLIDQIPNGILRWMGAGVQSFSDQTDDPAGGMVQYAAFGGAKMAGQISGALQQGAKTVGMGAGAPIRGLTDSIQARNNTIKAETGGGKAPQAGITKADD